MPTETVSAFRKIANTTVDRRVLLTGAVGAATIPLLAACSTGGGSGTKKTTSFNWKVSFSGVSCTVFSSGNILSPHLVNVLKPIL